MKKKKSGWYPISFLGGLIMALYSMVPVYIVYAEMLGILTHPSRIFASAGMSFVIAIVIIARRKGHKIFSRKDVHDPRSGFTLIELLVSISILGILAAIILPVVNGARSDAYFARAKAELKQVAISLERYALDYMNYPPDANRDIPAGLEQYLTTGNWPKAPWPGSVYDWDAWGPGSLAYPPHEQVYQISIRFCPVDQPAQCSFPREDWAENFDYYSSVYFCVHGPCRAHSSMPVNHPGYCVNC